MATTPRSGRSLKLLSWSQIRQQLENQPLPQPEDSIGLRIAVQCLVAVGIIAVDVAAADAADPLWISLWAVPVSAIGATWSWYRRRHRNISIKFCIALAMLLALAAFFVRLLNSPNDTRLSLAELLIQLQVFHSFDLPRRKDLGYSMIIGLILLGVAATLSQTMWFTPLLLTFLAIAIPTLILDYRSRLGLIPQRISQLGLDLHPRRLGLVLLITLGLGLTIFAFLPRLPGYQLRTFPVSTPIQFEGQFDSSTIINSGYVRQGRASQGTGTGEQGYVETGPGELNGSFYYGFNTQINQNLRGELTPKVVMRVRSQAAGFWRVMAFDRYTGQGWEVTRNDDSQIEKIERPSWSFRFNIPWSVTLNSTREVVQSYTIVADLPNLIPVLYEPKELYFPTQEVAIDAEGALRSPVPLAEGLTYTAVSEVPYRDRSRIRMSPPTYPRSIREQYLEMPATIRDRVRQTTEAILARSANPLADPYEKALFLAQHLKQNYSVQPDLPFLQENEDLVEAFLFKYEGGYPDHFSTVLTIMLRSIGIPARLVVGFGSGEFNPFTGYYIVRNTDAFAMTEVYFTNYGWFAFNPIPGAEAVPASIERSQTFSVLQQFWQWVAGWLPSPVAGLLNQLFEWIVQTMGWAIALFTSLFTRGWVGVLGGAILLTCLGFVGWLVWNGWRSWRYHLWLRKLPAMEALYQQMLLHMKLQGLTKSTAQTPLEYAQQVRHQNSSGIAEIVDEISQAYVRWRYGQESFDVTQLKQQLNRLRTQKSRKVKL